MKRMTYDEWYAEVSASAVQENKDMWKVVTEQLCLHNRPLYDHIAMSEHDYIEKPFTFDLNKTLSYLKENWDKFDKKHRA